MEQTEETKKYPIWITADCKKYPTHQELEQMILYIFFLVDNRFDISLSKQTVLIGRKQKQYWFLFPDVCTSYDDLTRLHFTMNYILQTKLKDTPVTHTDLFFEDRPILKEEMFEANTFMAKVKARLQRELYKKPLPVTIERFRREQKSCYYDMKDVDQSEKDYWKSVDNINKAMEINTDDNRHSYKIVN